MYYFLIIFNFTIQFELNKGKYTLMLYNMYVSASEVQYKGFTLDENQIRLSM